MEGKYIIGVGRFNVKQRLRYDMTKEKYLLGMSTTMQNLEYQVRELEAIKTEDQDIIYRIRQIRGIVNQMKENIKQVQWEKH